MAEKISVQIALEGGQEIQRQLADIGEAGQRAFADIAKSAEQVGGFRNLKADEVTQKLRALGIEGSEAFDKIGKAVQSAARLESIVQGVQSLENAFVALGRAAGPVGLAIAAGLKAATDATIRFAEEINKASDEAVKLGVSLEQLKARRAEFAKFGLDAKATGEALKHASDAAQKGKLDAVAKNLAELQEAMGRGFGVQGTKQLMALQEAAKGIGPAADAARKALVELGAPIPTEAPKTLAELGGDLEAFRAQLQQLPNTSERTQLAISQLGETAGTQLIQGLRRAEGAMKEGEAKAYDLQQALERAATAVAGFGSVQLAPAMTATFDAISDAVARLTVALAQNPWGVFLQAANAALNPIAALLTPITSALADLAAQIGSFAWDNIAAGAQAAWEAITQAVQGAGAAISDFLSSLAGFTWDAIASAGVAAWNAITQAIQGAIDAVAKFIGLAPSTPAAPATGGGGAPGLARGGRIHGRGSGTSDSILARLSAGEYVVPARVVAQPGVLALLELLRRRGGLPGYAAGGQVSRELGTQASTIAQAALDMEQSMVGVIDQISNATRTLGDRLATSVASLTNMADHLAEIGLRHGGLVGLPTIGSLVPRPAFARGGAVDAAHRNLGTLTLHMPDGTTVTGLTDQRIAEALGRAAVKSQVRSGGRKPTRYQ
jgi:hypothetical protein